MLKAWISLFKEEEFIHRFRKIQFYVTLNQLLATRKQLQVISLKNASEMNFITF